MKTSILITLLCLTSLTKIDYSEKYAKDCRDAISFYKENKTTFESTGKQCGYSADFLFAIVAPEVSQYNTIINKGETYSLKVLYVQGGKRYANFSIGYFQMKPSFIEQMEDSLSVNPVLKEKYASCLIDNPKSKEARITRLKRLEQLSWQFTYLSLFCALTENHFSYKKYISEEDRLRFFSAAYNTGFHQSEEIILKMQDKAMFPHFSFHKYKYADISCWFQKKVSESP